jgi:hypothetical protein
MKIINKNILWKELHILYGILSVSIMNNKVESSRQDYDLIAHTICFPIVEAKGLMCTWESWQREPHNDTI